MRLPFTLLSFVCCAALGTAQQPGRSPVQEFVRVPAGTIALEHVRVIDGTGGPATNDQTILILGDKIAAIGPSASLHLPESAVRMDFTGYTALPGLVGMHDHLFYPAGGGIGGELYYDMPLSFPRLYLACGVTTIRTTGAVETYTDLEIKREIEKGMMAGPKINVTGPYLDADGLPLLQVHRLTSPEDARRTVEYWAAEGAESFKAYNFLTRAELRAAIDEAHKHGLTITGHLCSIGFSEAAELGIDDLEHGLVVDTEFVPGKKPDVCPNPSYATAADMEVSGEAIQKMIRLLVAHHVAITSTLPVIEDLSGTRPPVPQRVLDAMSNEARAAYLKGRDETRARMQQTDSAFAKSMRRWDVMFPQGDGI